MICLYYIWNITASSCEFSSRSCVVVASSYEVNLENFAGLLESTLLDLLIIRLPFGSRSCFWCFFFGCRLINQQKNYKRNKKQNNNDEKFM